MNRRLPSLNALRCFDSVAAHLSIRKAAHALCVSESAVSRQIRILEQQLGMPLFLRTNNGLEITEAGQRLAGAVREAFDHIADALDPFRSDADEVTIRVLPTFALRWLYPRLNKFQAQHPLVRINVQTRLNDMNAGDGDADLGIRYGIGNWAPDAVSELYQEWVLPVCAPGYITGRALENPAEFADLTLLHPLPNRQDWSIWCERASLAGLDMQRSLDFDALDMALSAAEAGHGLAMADVVLAHSAIASGRLVTPRRLPVSTGMSYYLVKPPNLKRKRHVKLLTDWLCDTMREADEIIALYRG
ncbi:LysR family transcriptional regulator [Roseomonas aerophila]|uniref:LysR family transcriptional regulator n=1 Tax=Teichococcus aerophilus TaxID=1224513 RepID=A0ABR7RS54_9PROT|nr:LysR substrate-binding domain-containing protein [Pseudoroseomonas aerophila]MBC9208975.1 LysR family transcriptional regulator [Pseudoroseomonas aerophila]